MTSTTSAAAPDPVDRTLSRLSWVALAVIVAVTFSAGSVSLWLAGGVDPFMFVMLVFPAVGGLVAARRPRNTIGWILLLIGGVLAVGALLDVYSLVSVTTGADLPWADVAASLAQHLWIPGIGLIGTFLLLLFPDGHPPSPRWRPVAWGAATGLTLSYVGLTVSPGLLDIAPGVRVPNPLAVGLPPVEPLLAGLIALVPLSIAACTAGLVVRFRRAQGQERLQLQWLTTAAALTGSVYVTLVVANLPYMFSDNAVPRWMEAVGEVSVFAFVLIPVAIGVAILRHDLYDIDVVINRTLVYGLLTAALTSTYVVMVTALQRVLEPLTGRSDLAVAGSTLAVAGLFQPVRVRVQALIDGVFYRRRYDARRTVRAFAARVRDDVDLDVVTDDLVAVVRDVIQPVAATLWLRGGTERAGRDPGSAHETTSPA
ncbi:MAG TPA: hypothetical protein VFZ70_01680 [Euzebyales bacterium]